MNHDHFFQPPNEEQAQNRDYQENDSLQPLLYPWMTHHEHPPPESFPSAPGPLVFEGYIPDANASQPAPPGLANHYRANPSFESFQSQHHNLSFAPVLSNADSSPSSYSGLVSADNGDDGDQLMQDAGVQYESNENGRGRKIAGIRSTSSNRPTRSRAPRKTGFRGRGGWSKGLKLGPRPALDPSEEFNRLHQLATNAFIDQHDTGKALLLINKAIAVNPEVFSAHTLLSEIYFSMDNSKLAIDTLFIGAHASPHDPEIWQQVADACLQRSTYKRETSLEQALYAFNRLVRIDQNDHDSRFQRAAIHKELGKYHKALNELHVILRVMPHNSSVLKLYAEVCIDMGDIKKGLEIFKEAIQHYQEVGFTDEDSFTWPDVLVYVDLVARHVDLTTDPPMNINSALQKAVKALKRLARWLLGRQSESFWDNVEEDDREWDAEDEPRRKLTVQHHPERFEQEAYGLGLPLEIRTKLGLLRLKQDGFREEAMAHFEWLEPENNGDDAHVYNYPDLFLDVAFALNEAKEHKLALSFFEPLKRTAAFTDAPFWLVMGASSVICGKKDQAIDCYEAALKDDADSVEAKTRLSKLRAERGEKVIALELAKEAVHTAREAVPKTDRRKYERKDQRLARRAAEAALRHAISLNRPRNRNRRRKTTVVQSRPRHEDENESFLHPSSSLKQASVRSHQIRSRRAAFGETEAERAEKSVQFYTTLVNNTAAMRAGDEAAIGVWMDSARALIEDFRQNRASYPTSRQTMFKSHVKYGSQGTLQHDFSPASSLEADILEPRNLDSSLAAVETPKTYRGIPFTNWLDIFLEYAILLAKDTSMTSVRKECYAVISAALDCTIWSHDLTSLIQIYLCYLTCALAFRDKETLFNTVLRWFMRQFQFCTDAYRLFGAINLFLDYETEKGGKDGQMRNATFRSGPNQKYLLRQVKGIDSQLPMNYNDCGEEGPVPDFMRRHREEVREDDMDSKILLKPVEMDVVLLTLYAHVLYASGSFLSALSYLYRAYTLDPKNPVVLLSISFSYMHEMFKRQTENRHLYLLQGWAFFQEYEEARIGWATGRGASLLKEVEQEIEFNKARCWHMLGMHDLATRAYEKVLGMKLIDEPELDNLEYSMGAAYALQTMYAMSGNTEMARHITEKCLVVE